MTKYTNLQRFARDVIHPCLIGLKLWIVDEVTYIKNLLSTLNTEITDAYDDLNYQIISFKNIIRGRITAMNVFFTDTKNKLTNSLNAHAANKANPHGVTINQVAKIVSNVPTISQGTAGSIWLKYESAAANYVWKTGLWSDCSVTCGGGTQTRTVQCKNDSDTTVGDSYCTNLGLTKPDASRVCNSQACGIDAIFYNAIASGGSLWLSNATKGIVQQLLTCTNCKTVPHGPVSKFFTKNIPMYFYVQGAHQDDEYGGLTFIFTNANISKFVFQLHETIQGSSPTWDTALGWPVNPALGSAGLVKAAGVSGSWTWFFSLTYTG